MTYPYWCRVDSSGLVSDIRSFDGLQSQPVFQPLVQMPDGFGSFIYSSASRRAVLVAKRVARLPRDVIVDLNGLTNAQNALVLSDLNSSVSGVGTPPKWQFSSSPVVWSQAPIFRNYSGVMQKESLLVAVAFFCIENPMYLTSGVLISGINIAGDRLSP